MFTRTGFAVVVAASALAACSSESADDSAASKADLVGLSTSCSTLSDVPGMRIRREIFDDGHVSLRIGVMEPEGEPKGDVLFLHGFADRFDNHLPLFEQWRGAGMRVIAFDYPSHGETCGQGIDRYKINGVAALAADVVKSTEPSTDRPLMLAGWSTGGLLAVRMLEAPEIAPLGRPVKGAFLLAPGVDVALVVGDKTIVTEDTLTSDPNPPHRGAISPKSPLETPIFAADLVLNARLSRRDPFPKDVPTVVVSGGEKEDVYVHTDGVKDWVKSRRDENARVYGVGCEGARHELDNERAPIRDDVRTSAARFASWVIGGAEGSAPTDAYSVCKTY
jgi:alpha-beta hydrolase superfamily lysophospholipase